MTSNYLHDLLEETPTSASARYAVMARDGSCQVSRGGACHIGVARVIDDNTDYVATLWTPAPAVYALQEQELLTQLLNQLSVSGAYLDKNPTEVVAQGYIRKSVDVNVGVFITAAQLSRVTTSEARGNLLASYLLRQYYPAIPPTYALALARRSRFTVSKEDGSLRGKLPGPRLERFSNTTEHLPAILGGNSLRCHLAGPDSLDSSYQGTRTLRQVRSFTDAGASLTLTRAPSPLAIEPINVEGDTVHYLGGNNRKKAAAEPRKPLFNLDPFRELLSRGSSSNLKFCFKQVEEYFNNLRQELNLG